LNINNEIKNILDRLPENLIETSEELAKIGVTKEVKIAYYLYREITRKMVEADVEFHIADDYEQKRKYFRKNFNELQSNKVLCKHINQAYQKALNDCARKYKEKGINLDIESEIEFLHPENEITHSDIILKCNGRPIFCNPILDLLESKSEYRIKYFARSLEENPYPEYQERLRKKYGEFYSLTLEDKEKLDKELGQDFKGIYTDEFEKRVFKELRDVSTSLTENIKEDKTSYSNIYTESGMYQYLKNNKERYNLEDDKNLQKSKIDFILENLSYMYSDKEEINVLSKYLYYIRLIRRVFEEEAIGDYNIFPCKYKNENPKKVELLLILNLDNEKFAYILPSNDDKFYEIPMEKLKSRIKDNNNPLVLYNRPYKIETGPLVEEKINIALDDFER